MNWSKGFLIFSLFVLGLSVIYFLVMSYQLRSPGKPEVRLEPHDKEAFELPQIRERSVFSEEADQPSEVVEMENDVETANDVPVDSIVESLTDESEEESRGITETLPPKVKLKIERYAKLAKILPAVKELEDRKFQLTKQNENYIKEHYRKLRLQGGPYPEPDPAIEEEYQATVKIIDKEVSDYYRQIGDMFPELDATYEVQGFDNMILLLDREVLREYFGRKLPWDGNPDYFSSQ